MERAKKTQEIASLVERFGKAKASFLVDFKGMNVEQVTDLRKKLSPLQSEMKVVRNTLARIAVKENASGEDAYNDHLVGTNAFVFSFEDPSATAKLLDETTKDVEHLQIKTGVMGGKLLDENKIKYLATLPPKDVLRAQLLGTLAAPATKFVRQLAAPASNFVLLLSAYKTKNEG